MIILTIHIFRMKAIIGLLALVAAEITTEGGVLVGTKENFDEILENNDFVLVEFCK
jgi:hypothetical protein